ncbi:hypothetical protein Pmani_031651 [Petrolisthes manimaculis]|uniref:CUB domain-containing protein n=1 Tax=Petrolisthes manimaculis TaxID=1843537 RepID=A0AAE1NTA0_9EUCA|nr:hypothetical protein Pmani_031651 [Petrolisthes manimaculis]
MHGRVRCSTDYVAVYAGTSTSSPLIDSLCGSQTRTIRFSGPSVLVDFSSGPRVPQYKHSGFLATVTFSGVVGVPSLPSTPKPPRVPALHNPQEAAAADEGAGGRVCDQVYRSNVTREGIFDTSALAPGRQTCCLRFIGNEEEVVQVSLFKYNIGGRNCQSEASIYDGLTDDPGDNLLRRLCGPMSREPRDATGRFLQQEFFLSSANALEIRLNLGQNTNFLSQYLVGGYHFHNSLQEGTKNPGSVCDVMFYGASSPGRGSLIQPSTTLLWNVEGALNCSYLFVPTSSQSLTITVQEGMSTATKAHCTTECGEEGCQCQPSMVALQHVDHLLLVHTLSHNVIACFCGDVKEERRLVVNAGGGVDLIYHVAHFTWATPGFNFTLDYRFAPAAICGPEYYSNPTGEIGPRQYTTPVTNILYVTCHWGIASPQGAALALTVSPPSQGSCATWNLTVESAGKDKNDKLRGNACAAEDTTLFDIPAHHLAAEITLELRGEQRHDWLLTWNTHWPPRLPPTTSVSPKPELSRTSDLHPTRYSTI